MLAICLRAWHIRQFAIGRTQWLNCVDTTERVDCLDIPRLSGLASLPAYYPGFILRRPFLVQSSLNLEDLSLFGLHGFISRRWAPNSGHLAWKWPEPFQTGEWRAGDKETRIATGRKDLLLSSGGASSDTKSRLQPRVVLMSRCIIHHIWLARHSAMDSNAIFRHVVWFL